MCYLYVFLFTLKQETLMFWGGFRFFELWVVVGFLIIFPSHLPNFASLPPIVTIITLLWHYLDHSNL